LSVLTLGAIRKGPSLLPPSKRRTELEAWLAKRATGTVQWTIAAITGKIADLWGEMTAQAQIKGTSVPVVDSLLAATARHHQLTIATRNVQDFSACGVPVINPWEIALRNPSPDTVSSRIASNRRVVFIDGYRQILRLSSDVRDRLDNMVPRIFKSLSATRSKESQRKFRDASNRKHFSSIVDGTSERRSVNRRSDPEFEVC
jgi:predicted nucleic acid-binding protein